MDRHRARVCVFRRLVLCRSAADQHDNEPEIQDQVFSSGLILLFSVFSGDPAVRLQRDPHAAVGIRSLQDVLDVRDLPRCIQLSEQHKEPDVFRMSGLLRPHHPVPGRDESEIQDRKVPDQLNVPASEFSVAVSGAVRSSCAWHPDERENEQAAVFYFPVCVCRFRSSDRFYVLPRRPCGLFRRYRDCLRIVDPAERFFDQTSDSHVHRSACHDEYHQLCIAPYHPAIHQGARIVQKHANRPGHRGQTHGKRLQIGGRCKQLQRILRGEA